MCVTVNHMLFSYRLYHYNHWPGRPSLFFQVYEQVSCVVYCKKNTFTLVKSIVFMQNVTYQNQDDLDFKKKKKKVEGTRGKAFAWRPEAYTIWHFRACASHISRSFGRLRELELAVLCCCSSGSKLVAGDSDCIRPVCYGCSW